MYTSNQSWSIRPQVVNRGSRAVLGFVFLALIGWWQELKVENNVAIQPFCFWWYVLQNDSYSIFRIDSYLLIQYSLDVFGFLIPTYFVDISVQYKSKNSLSVIKAKILIPLLIWSPHYKSKNVWDKIEHPLLGAEQIHFMEKFTWYLILSEQTSLWTCRHYILIQRCFIDTGCYIHHFHRFHLLYWSLMVTFACSQSLSRSFC